MQQITTTVIHTHSNFIIEPKHFNFLKMMLLDLKILLINN